MGMMDNDKNKMGNSDEMREQFEMLKQKEQEGSLDDKGRAKLEELREHFNK